MTDKKTSKKNIEDAYPLAPMQEGLLFQHLTQPESEAYQEQFSFSVRVKIDVSALKRALELVMQRHPTLRTAFAWKNLKKPLQIVGKSARFPLEVIDWSLTSKGDAARLLKNLLKEDLARKFDISRAPLIRMTLVIMEENQYYFILSNHHLILDGWSRSILLQEIFSLHRALQENRYIDPPRPASFRTYVDWVGRQDQADAERFWREQLQDFTTPVTPATMGRKYARNETTTYDLKMLRLSDAETEAVTNFARKKKLTLNTLIQAAWALLLHRYSGESDIVFGVTVAGRPADLDGFESMTGLFINTLPLRLKIRGAVLDFLQQVQSAMLELRRYEYTSLAKAQSWSGVEQGRSLFDTILVFENIPGGGASKNGFVMFDPWLDSKPHYPLSAVVFPGREILLQIVYDTRLFNMNAVLHMLEHFKVLLLSISKDEEQNICELQLMSATERRQLLDFSGDTIELPPSNCIHTVFEAQVLRFPENIAVVFEDESLSYRELNDRANQLAHFLLQKNFAPETPIGVFMERSASAVTAKLAVLKAGGVHLPLDPRYPLERIRHLLTDAGARIVLTHEALLEKLPETEAQIVCIDRDNEKVRRMALENPANRVTGDNLAYIIYTSGSTGRPKGVLATHTDVIGLFASVQSWAAFDEHDVWSFFHSSSFDFSVWEIWGALLHGGRLVVVDFATARDPQAFYELLCEERVTVLNQTPSSFQQLMRAQEEGLSHSLRLILFGGEALRLKNLEPWFARHGARPQLVNMYGITETIVHVTRFPVNADDMEREQSIIGRSLSNKKVYILDEHMRLALKGTPGEMYIGGAGQARGYLGRADLTAERFVPDPFSDDGGRLYRSGDIGRFLDDGNIEYVGRGDKQIKLRGFRIEPGEIEACLAEHPKIEQAIVTVKAEGEIKRLVAHAAGAKDTNPDEVQDFLKRKLPDHMIPALFVFMDSLPLTPNGKIDKAALPPPEQARPRLQQNYAAPRNETEAKLAEIWSATLGVASPGMHDNFFKLGGDSILSIQIVSRAAREGLQITPGQVFDYPTIAGLATVAAFKQKIEHEQGAVSGVVPLLPIQKWFFELETPNPHHYNQAWLFQTKIRPAGIENVIAELVKHHDALRLRFTRRQSQWSQHILASDDGSMFTLVDMTNVQDWEKETFIRSETAALQEKLNIENGPMLRMAFFDAGPAQPCYLFMVIHHLCVDGVSWRILLEDFRLLYEQLQKGESPTPPPKTASFKVWSEKIGAYARSEAVQQEAVFWKKQLATPAGSLPRDFADGENTVRSAHNVMFALSATETEDLLRRAPEAYNTRINDILLAALFLTLRNWSKNDVLRIHLEGHGREDLFEGVDVSRTVGWFTSLFPLTITLNGSSVHPQNALTAVKELLRSIPNNGIAYGMLRYLSNVGAELARFPKPEIAFNYLGQFDATMESSVFFEIAANDAGPVQGAASARYHLLDVNCLVMEGCLRFYWTFSENVHRREAIEKLAGNYVSELRAVVAHCLDPNAGGYTPSDFPEAELSQGDLESVLDEIQLE